jgi:hypothetical protein
MEAYSDHWIKVNGSTSVPLFGFEYTVGLEPIRVNVDRMINSFQSGLRELTPVWERVLAKETFEEIQRLEGLSGEVFRFSANLWVRTVYDFAVAYHKMVINREHLLKSLTPLYLARTASFVLETPEAGAEEVDQILESLCQEYETLKPYLIERWGS